MTWVERLEREADHLSPSSAGVKKAWNYTSKVAKTSLPGALITGTVLPLYISVSVT